MLAVEDESVTGSEFTAELQDEISKLKRQYRLLKEDRKAYQKDTRRILQSQRQVILDLMGEEKELLTDFRLLNHRRGLIATNKAVQNLQSLLEFENELKSSIENENLELRGCEEKTSMQKKEMLKISRFIGRKMTMEERIVKGQRRKRMLETRLEQTTQRFDKTLARNATHRQNIESITLERKRFSDLHKKLEAAYSQGAKEKRRLIQSTQSLQSSREEAKHRMNSLKEKASRDLSTFNAEFRDLLRVIDNDKRLREFMATKVRGLNDVYDQIMKANREKKMADEMKALQSEVEYYSEILGRLMEVSGLSDVDDMVTRYIAIEDQNFALFTFVKDQELLLEELQSEIESLQAEIVKLRSLNSTITAERKVILKELEEKLKRVSETRRTNSAENKRAHKILHEAKKMVWSLCRKISRNGIGFPGVPSNPIVNDNNVAEFLGIIENKANEFLQIKLLIAIEKYDDKAIKFLHSTWIGQFSNSTKLPSSPLPELPENLELLPDSLGESQPPATNQNGDDTC